jgi:ATP-dependent Clp protease ATP-binding subunit ClpC
LNAITNAQPEKKLKGCAWKASSTRERDKWEAEHKLDEVVDESESPTSYHNGLGILSIKCCKPEAERFPAGLWKPNCTSVIIGQDEAITQSQMPYARAFRLEDPNALLAPLFLFGPSGVGKTDLAKPGSLHVR